MLPKSEPGSDDEGGGGGGGGSDEGKIPSFCVLLHGGLKVIVFMVSETLQSLPQTKSVVLGLNLIMYS